MTDTYVALLALALQASFVSLPVATVLLGSCLLAAYPALAALRWLPLAHICLRFAGFVRMEVHAA